MISKIEYHAIHEVTDKEVDILTEKKFYRRIRFYLSKFTRTKTMNITKYRYVNGEHESYCLYYSHHPLNRNSFCIGIRPHNCLQF